MNLHHRCAGALVALGSVLLMMSCQSSTREFGQGDRDDDESEGGSGATGGKGSAGSSGSTGGLGTGNTSSTEGGDEGGGGVPATNTGGSDGNAGGGMASGGGMAGGGGAASGGSGGASSAGTGGSGGGAPKSNGAACADAGECTSGVCGSEGVCCDVACDGQCESCVSSASPGTCVAVTTPRTPCAGTGTSCGGTCNGTNRKNCVYPSAATTCAAASCSAAGARGPSKCSGAGACVAPNPTTCVYGCDGVECATCRQKDASNLLTNPGFDGAVTSWKGATFANYSSNDADSCTGSGSFALDYLQEFSQCLNDVSVGTRYYMAFRFKGWDTTQSHLAYCVVNFYEGNDCNGSDFISGHSFDASTTSAGPWATAVTNNAVAPAGAESMAFACSGSVGHGYYDQLYLGTSSTARF